MSRTNLFQIARKKILQLRQTAKPMAVRFYLLLFGTGLALITFPSIDSVAQTNSFVQVKTAQNKFTSEAAKGIGNANQTSSCVNCPKCSTETAPDCAGWQGFEYARPKRKGHFVLYTPKGLRAPPPGTGGAPPMKAPLVVMLHGCLQSVKTLSQSTKMNFISERENFYVLWPEQTSADQPLACWPWYNSTEQSREGPTAEWIQSFIQDLKSKVNIDPDRIFVAGLSAGGAFANLLLSCYPDVFSAAAVHSGLAFAVAQNETEAKTVMKSGTNKSIEEIAKLSIACQLGPNPAPGASKVRERKLMVIHGSADKSVHLQNATAQKDSWLLLQDLLDNDTIDKSFVTSQEDRSETQSPSSRAFSRSTYKAQNKIILDVIQIEGLAHAWSGGEKGLPFSDPIGPSASEMIWQQFSQ